MIEMERQRQLEKLQKEKDEKEKESQPPSKRNPLLALNDPADEKEDGSVDATAPTQAATTPGSTCASSSLRARSMSGDRYITTCSTEEELQNTPKHASGKLGTHNGPTIIPNCVAFTNDSSSVQSNLPSPSSSKQPIDMSMEVDEEDEANPDVALYKDFKMFQSLAIPADDEIDEYHRDQELKQ